MNRWMQKLIWPLILAVLGVTMYFGWKALREAEPLDGGGQGKRPPSVVVVKPVELRLAVERFDATGELRPVRRSQVAAVESALLIELDVREGQRVERGERLARQDARRFESQLTELRSALAVARAELGQREAEYERAVTDQKQMSRAWEEQAVAERDYLDSVMAMEVAKARKVAAEAGIDSAEKRIELIEIQRKDLVVEAPFTGRVVERHAEIGEWLASGDPVVTLVATGKMDAWLPLPERYAALMDEVEPAQVVLRVTGGDEPVAVDRLTVVPDVVGRSRRFYLIAHVSDEAERLTPGVSVAATVPLGKPQKRLVVMADAVVQAYDGYYVYLPEKRDAGVVAKRVPVEVLFTHAGESVIAADGELGEGDEVIVEGNERLFPGAAVEPRAWSEVRGKSEKSKS